MFVQLQRESENCCSFVAVFELPFSENGRRRVFKTRSALSRVLRIPFAVQFDFIIAFIATRGIYINLLDTILRPRWRVWKKKCWKRKNRKFDAPKRFE